MLGHERSSPIEVMKNDVYERAQSNILSIRTSLKQITHIKHRAPVFHY